MFSLKMQEFLLGLLSLIFNFKGSTCSSRWSMTVQAQVNVSMGQRVVLPCVFTHPKQNNYTSNINVSWMQDSYKNPPFFKCIFWNNTNGQDNCSDARPPKRFFLHGNPRKGDISLGITNLQFTDTKQYFCRVELKYDSFLNTTGTLLHITAPAQIISLDLDSEATDQSGMLTCIAQGKPLPDVKWSSSSGSLKDVPKNRNDYSNFIVISSVPFSDQDVYTCQAVNLLGRAERTYPPKDSGLLLWFSALGSLLLLGIVVFVVVMITRRRCSQRAVQQHMENVQTGKTSTDQDNDTPVYANVKCYPVGAKMNDVK
ncbi:sialic acid binding Ig-like lectin 15, like isoform X2 [Myxocyprinus asiaticus]|uniref:sialic acid binding Ig-like lectin 15, like isoform X2 n=1 Tax=Myxocyprinus asiaticus TaxID=70543 RepID=UPI00222346E5|nr:sialic acid binding Ig-like lectin 15, like isoform X2 [Myxocyprinus asiaticus]XP_051577011.1 sialic acid binding Ig-like lectin 15, like isoform X2 [Myxocyprinus asiaticus]